MLRIYFGTGTKPHFPLFDLKIVYSYVIEVDDFECAIEV